MASAADSHHTTATAPYVRDVECCVQAWQIEEVIPSRRPKKWQEDGAPSYHVLT